MRFGTTRWNPTQLRPVATISAVALLWLTLGSHSSSAASFDCGKAGTAQEKLICSDQSLSDLDDKVGSRYQDTMAMLPESGRNILKTTQRLWLAYLRRCPTSRNKSMSACIRSAYELRLKQLDNAVTGVGPLRFLKLAVDIDRDAPADQSERRNRRSSPGSFTATVEFPQIIDPDTPETAAWNKIFYRDAHSDEGMCAYSGEHYQSYEIKYASDRLISLAVSEYTYCWPAPRGEENRQVLNYYVGNEPRPLKAEDVFDETTPWADFISKKCLDLAKASGLFDDHDENAAWRAQVREKHIKHTVVDTGQWGISQNGLTIVAPFVISNFVTDGEAQDVTITWAELTPFLRKDFKAVGSPAH